MCFRIINKKTNKKQTNSGIDVQLECQTVKIHIRPDILSGLIWIQTVCKCYKQSLLEIASLGESVEIMGLKITYSCNL